MWISVPRSVTLALIGVALSASACATSRGAQEPLGVNIEVLNNLRPSFEVRVFITPVGNRSRTAPIGWVRLGEATTFRSEVQPGRYYLSAAGIPRGQTAVLRERNPKSTRLRSDTFTIDDRVERAAWTLSTNHIQVRPPL